ncbi:MAG: subfamily B ATP-binding cassette protein MsbA [Cryomorphaceae bacterium]|jgi:subfamily B ATP-binding cassette protein MsbA
MKRFKPYFHYLKPVKAKLIIGIIAGVIAGAAMSAGLPLMIDKVFPVIFASEETGVAKDAPAWLEWLAGDNVLIVACLMLPAVFMISGVFGYISKLLLSYVGLRVLEEIRVDVFRRLQKLSLGFHGKQKGGDLLSRVMGDTLRLQQVLSKVVVNTVVLPGKLLGSAAVLTYLSMGDSSVMFMLIALITVPLCVFPIRILIQKLAKKAALMMGKQGDISAIVSENLASQPVVRAYMMEENQVEKLKEDTAKFLEFNMGVQKYRYLVSPTVEIVSAIGIGIAIYLGSLNGLTLQKFLPLLVALYAAYDPVKKLANLSSIMREGEVALDRLEFILHNEDEILDCKDAQPFGTARGAVAFESCQFSYGDSVILDEVNVSVQAGETIALVGESGAGKSTFVSLIPRFFEVQSGEVKLDGINVNQMLKSDLRRNIALVSQQPLLFRGTVAENILIGKPSGTRDEVIEAANNASAHEFISSLPDGYDTELGERGEGLSGGQRQRIVIARAFLKDASILILDEATSALDSESEAQIQKALKVLSEGRTTFLIAHRFSSIRDAGRILVFAKGPEGGRIVADGPHEEIYQTCSIYKSLYDKQK